MHTTPRVRASSPELPPPTIPETSIQGPAPGLKSHRCLCGQQAGLPSSPEDPRGDPSLPSASVSPSAKGAHNSTSSWCNRDRCTDIRRKQGEGPAHGPPTLASQWLFGSQGLLGYLAHLPPSTGPGSHTCPTPPCSALRSSGPPRDGMNRAHPLDKKAPQLPEWTEMVAEGLDHPCGLAGSLGGESLPRGQRVGRSSGRPPACASGTVDRTQWQSRAPRGAPATREGPTAQRPQKPLLPSAGQSPA